MVLVSYSVSVTVRVTVGGPPALAVVRRVVVMVDGWRVIWPRTELDQFVLESVMEALRGRVDSLRCRKE